VIPSDNDQVLHFWDAATGREVGEWEPPDSRGPGGRVGRLQTTNAGRYFVADIRPDHDPTGGSSNPVVDWLVKHFPSESRASDRERVAVLDIIDRDTPSQVPGVSAAVSENDRWLATLDADGVVHVWELPLYRPWGRAFLYAAVVVLGGWGLGRLVARRHRRRGTVG
jgi:hypothetical protein